MADDEPQCKVEYIDVDPPEETNWIKRGGKARVTYVNTHTFEGTFDAERIKQGAGVYIWMGPASADDETPVEKARFEGIYKDGARNGFGRMVYPNGDVYEGEWVDNKMHGEGTYTYKKSGDIYSGSWKDGIKSGDGRYEYGADSSMLVGSWYEGTIVGGNWELKGFGVYSGEFKLGRPFGEGKFVYDNGLQQSGKFVVKKVVGEEEEVPAEGEAPVPPNVEWKGDSVVAF